MSELKVGQKLWLRYCGFDHRKSREITEVIISKIGNKYFYVEGEGYYGGGKFDKENMQQAVDSNYKDTAYLSMEEIEKEDEFESLSNNIRAAFNGYNRINYSLEQLRAIKAILNPS